VIARFELILRRIRRGFGRSEWMARLLGLPPAADGADGVGLVMVQIDGLSHHECRRALDAGELPFLRQLIARQHYLLHRVYSGLPSSTAAFQGELFYGVRGAVAGFNFFDRETGELVRMFEPSTAVRVERRIGAQGGALLAGGSCYVDNFTGGAAEPHFCPAAGGWGPRLGRVGRLKRTIFYLAHLPSLVRVALLTLLELALALADCVRGTIAGEDPWKELKFVPVRVGVAVLLRELATIGVGMDVARGLPIVHVNFLGYDEQAHRRGPASRFAHWTLKGIDGAIARIWSAAHRSGRRRYEVWIYSDHGQEQTLSYEQLHGRRFAEAVAEAFGRALGGAVPYRASGAWGAQIQRIAAFGAGRRGQGEEPSAAEMPLLVAPLGPVAMIYYRDALPAEAERTIAEWLAGPGGVPLLLAVAGEGRARAWTADGEFTLPADAALLLGDGHPFVAETARDLVALCHHADAGRFIACGWRRGSPALSFVTENGAHGGIGPRETCAFALLPDDAPLPVRDRSHLRAGDLHQAARQLLDRRNAASPRQRTPGRVVSVPASVRVMSYNVHSCIGMDGRLAPERIARMIARHGADVIALQELDVGRPRTGGLDQVHLIARYLAMDFHFHPALHLEDERYGDAILTHLPMRLVRAGALPGAPGLEPRGALWVAVDAGGGRELQVINTHLGLDARERRLQVDALLGPQWLEHADCRAPVVLCGDFNALPASPACRRLRQRLRDVQTDEARRPSGTFFGRFPLVRIDYIFASRDMSVLKVEVPRSALARVASDHLPLIAELGLPGAPRTGDSTGAA
jgi:endonuclease/exonuclease/phosphatase family metal-dependent hydrolase